MSCLSPSARVATWPVNFLGLADARMGTPCANGRWLRPGRPSPALPFTLTKARSPGQRGEQPVEESPQLSRMCQTRPRVESSQTVAARVQGCTGEGGRSPCGQLVA